MRFISREQAERHKPWFFQSTTGQTLFLFRKKTTAEGQFSQPCDVLGSNITKLKKGKTLG